MSAYIEPTDLDCLETMLAEFSDVESVASMRLLTEIALCPVDRPYIPLTDAVASLARGARSRADVDRELRGLAARHLIVVISDRAQGEFVAAGPRLRRWLKGSL